jgi:hypothetical protein
MSCGHVHLHNYTDVIEFNTQPCWTLRAVVVAQHTIAFYHLLVLQVHMQPAVQRIFLACIAYNTGTPNIGVE